LIIATLINASMMFAVIFIPGVNSIFRIATMDLHHWEIVAALIWLPLPFVEMMKVLHLNGKN